MIRKERGGHFDPKLVDIFLRHSDEIVKIRQNTGDIFMPDDVVAWSERDLAENIDLKYKGFGYLKKRWRRKL